MGIPKLAMFFAGFLILSLVLMEASHIDDYAEREYTHNGVSCPSCEPGMRVTQHCTLQFSTQCERCPDGEYSDRYTGSEKCLECKSCDQELGLQTKENCTTTHNTICEPREGYYCTDNCERARNHTECPPGEGVKEKGTPFNDTVCEKCPHGTFSSEASTTEECKNWTVCETLKFQQFKPGSAEADVKCKAEHSWIDAIHVVVTIVLVLICLGIVTFVLWKKCKYKRGNSNIQDTRNHDGDGKVTEPLRKEEKAE